MKNKFAADSYSIDEATGTQIIKCLRPYIDKDGNHKIAEYYLRMDRAAMRGLNESDIAAMVDERLKLMDDQFEEERRKNERD